MWDYFRLPAGIVRHDAQTDVIECLDLVHENWFVPENPIDLKRAVDVEGQSIDERQVQVALRSFQKPEIEKEKLQ